MARPRQFDEERAVDAAMRAFIRSGYEATSTQDLCEATGLGRSSIYNTFTSKHELFTKALRYYMDVRTATIIATLESEVPVHERIDTLFRMLLEPKDGLPPGCLVVNSMIELAPHDAEVAKLLKRDYDRRFAAIRTALAAAQAAGEISPDKDPGALAHFVISSIGGMQVALRGGATPDTVRSIAQTVLQAL
ncbi:TetR/AcrR family transcriptional regulator [Nonomuraea typhae]|uniref:TetR/AcrR family transcriptional regulator n=1 Tax=Nonomuraea typhae TaxID=2603600 RepID=UPI0012FCB7B0|nr:TetR/AcrR family transcriptional regulator [Nonomuraea typhae]